MPHRCTPGSTRRFLLLLGLLVPTNACLAFLEPPLPWGQEDSGAADGGSDVEAGPTYAECVPGEAQAVPCGWCGMETVTCVDAGVWEYGTCAGQGVCEPGVDYSDDGCSAGSSRLCQIDCTWGSCGAD